MRINLNKINTIVKSKMKSGKYKMKSYKLTRTILFGYHGMRVKILDNGLGAVHTGGSWSNVYSQHPIRLEQECSQSILDIPIKIRSRGQLGLSIGLIHKSDITQDLDTSILATCTYAYKCNSGEIQINQDF